MSSPEPRGSGDLRDQQNHAPGSDPAVEPFKGEILVSSRIIDELSSGLYESPAACLKELINNGYDADATEVLMSVRPDADVIIINDNGTGLTRDTFERHFHRIAESRKRDDSQMTSLGRPKIGRIGIGFIAANEICDRMDIVSTTAGSVDLLEVSIDFAKMRVDPSERRRMGVDMAKGDYEGQTTPNAPLEEHYTRVYLRNIRGPAQAVLSGAQEGRRHNSLYGLKPSSVRDRLADPKLSSWDEFDSYSRAILEIALNVPVRYHNNWLPREYEDLVRPFTERAAALDFEVIVDGSPLRKPIVLRPGPDGKSFLRVFEISRNNVGAKCYFYAASGKLLPRDLNGVLIRIRNVAVGNYDSGFMGYPSWLNPLFSAWATCEVYADDKLERALNIDRKTLRITDPPYIDLRSAFHDELKKCFAQVREELYRQRSVRRNRERAEEQSRQLNQIKDRLTPSLGPDSASDVVNKLRAPRPPGRANSARSEDEELPFDDGRGDDTPEHIDVKVLTSKYTAVQVIDLVAQAAIDVGLSAEMTRQLLSEVARRLRG